MGPHTEIVRQMKNLRGLRFNPVLKPAPDREWGGIGELWFDSIDDARAAFEAEPIKKVLGEDRPRFLGGNQGLPHEGADHHSPAALKGNHR
jgi:hypothetical protein